MTINDFGDLTVTLAEEAQYLLPPMPIIYRNELDLYGFSHMLAEYCNLSSPPRAFASWNHGWLFCPSDAPHHNYPGNYLLSPSNIPHVVHRPVLYKQLMEHGFTNVHLGQLPFAFTEASGLERIRDSLLVALHHTSTHLQPSELRFIEKILSIKDDFRKVSFCIYADPEEVLNKHVIEICAKHGFSVYFGAAKYDRNSLRRLRRVYDMHEYMFTNTLGSGILYAAYCGCKVGVAAPPCYADFSETVDPRNRFIYSLDNFGKWFPNFLVDHPKAARTHHSWAVEEIGSSYKMTARQIRDVVGWSFRGKINGFGRYLVRNLFDPIK